MIAYFNTKYTKLSHKSIEISGIIFYEEKIQKELEEKNLLTSEPDGQQTMILKLSFEDIKKIRFEHRIKDMKKKLEQEKEDEELYKLELELRNKWVYLLILKRANLLKIKIKKIY